MKQNVETFGEIISRKSREEKGWTLREFCKRLEAKGSKITSIKLSKIMRGIQNPSNKEEFDEIMDILEISNQERKELERIAQSFIPVKQPSEEDLLNNMPIFINKQFKDEKELEKFQESFKELIKNDFEPEP